MNFILPDDTMYNSISYGDPNVIEYLHSIGVKYTESSIDTAAQRGRFTIVKYLHKVLGLRCTSMVIRSIEKYY